MADLLLLRFCNKVQELYGTSAVTPNMHLHCHLKDILLDYGPVQEFWLFSFERYNGILGNQPTNNRAIEEQLMKRFIRDNMVNSFKFPQQFKDDFSSIVINEKLIGSVGETHLTYTKETLPSKYTRDAFDSDTRILVQTLIQKVNQASDTDELNVNSVFLQYSSLNIKGKTFSCSGKRPFIAQAEWKEEYYGIPPTPLIAISEPRYRLHRRPVKIRNYLKVNYSINSVASSIVFAFVSWMKPHEHRYHIGKPAELWKDQHEIFGIHSFLPLDIIICRCAHGMMDHNGENLRVIIPLL